MGKTNKPTLALAPRSKRAAFSALGAKRVWNTVETGQVRFEFCAWKNSDSRSKTEILGPQRRNSPRPGSTDGVGNWTARFGHRICHWSCAGGFWFCFAHDWRRLFARCWGHKEGVGGRTECCVGVVLSRRRVPSTERCDVAWREREHRPCSGWADWRLCL